MQRSGYSEGKTIIDTLPPEEVERWWQIYDSQFQELNRTNPCRQSFNREEFEGAIASPTMAKLAYVEDGEITAREVNKQSLEALIATRNVDFGPIHMKVVD